MSDRLKGFIVMLADDIRDDDAKPALDAIAMIRGVQAVHPMVAYPMDWMARERARQELVAKLWAVLHPAPEVQP